MCEQIFGPQKPKHWREWPTTRRSGCHNKNPTPDRLFFWQNTTQDSSSPNLWSSHHHTFQVSANVHSFFATSTQNKKATMRIVSGCLLLAGLWTTASAAVSERNVLLSFYQATGGGAWSKNSGWASQSQDICDWYGVICNDNSDGPAGKVVGLVLPDNFLTGRTPSSLWTLPSLAQVDLSNNAHLEVDFSGLQQATGSPLQSLKLRGTATTSVVGIAGASNTLEEVDLSQSEIDSQLPPELYALTQLKTLVLAECGLVGSLPGDIQRLSLLRDLDVFQNSITGTIPDSFSRLVHLRHLSLSYNQFHGIIPGFFNDFVMMRELWAHNNDFIGPIPGFSQAPDIHKIYLNNNALTGALPSNFLEATIGGMDRTETIHVNLASNALTGPVPTTLDNLEDVEIIWMLGDNEWTGVPETLCDNSNWNEGAVEQFGCFGFLCPPNSYSRHGFQTADTQCQPCASAEFFGATNCFDKDDRSVLVEIYIQLEGEKWIRSDNWMTDDNFCEWYGVECWDNGDSKDGRVRKILLPNNSLRGNVPETIYRYVCRILKTDSSALYF